MQEYFKIGSVYKSLKGKDKGALYRVLSHNIKDKDNILRIELRCLKNDKKPKKVGKRKRIKIDALASEKLFKEVDNTKYLEPAIIARESIEKYPMLYKYYDGKDQKAIISEAEYKGYHILFEEIGKLISQPYVQIGNDRYEWLINMYIGYDPRLHKDGKRMLSLTFEKV